METVIIMKLNFIDVRGGRILFVVSQYVLPFIDVDLFSKRVLCSESHGKNMLLFQGPWKRWSVNDANDHTHTHKPPF